MKSQSSAFGRISEFAEFELGSQAGWLLFFPGDTCGVPCGGMVVNNREAGVICLMARVLVLLFGGCCDSGGRWLQVPSVLPRIVVQKGRHYKNIIAQLHCYLIASACTSLDLTRLQTGERISFK